MPELKEWNSFLKVKPPLGPILIIMRHDPEEELRSEIWLDRYFEEKILLTWLAVMAKEHANLWWRLYTPP